MTWTPIDGIVFALFLAAIFALGFSTRLRKLSALEFLTAGRSLSLPAFVATLVSTWYGGILGIGESVSYFGIGTWLLLGLPYYVFAAIYAQYMATQVRGAEQYTIPERLGATFGRRTAFLGATLIFLLAVPAAHVLMLGVLVQQLSGWELGASIAVGALIGSLFLYKGGLLADVRVGMLAFIGMYVGFAAIAIFSLLRQPIGDAVAQLDAPLQTFTGGQSWTAILTFFILGAWTIVDPGFHQRVASARTPETGRKGVWVSIGFWCLFDLMSITVAIYAVTGLQTTPQSPVAIFPAYAEQALPPGLKAIFLCGILGTVVSAMVGYTLVAAGSIGREVVGRLKGDLESPAVVTWTRIAILASILLAIGLAVSVQSVKDLWYAWSGCVVGALLIPVVISYRNEKSALRSGAMDIAMTAGFLVSFVWFIHGLRTNNPMLEVAWIGSFPSGRLAVPPLSPEDALANPSLWSVGTLIPALAVSSLVLGIARIVRGLRPKVERGEG